MWDYAAGSLIVTESGALVELHCPENDALVVAAPARLFDMLRPLVDPLVTILAAPAVSP